MVLQNKKRKSHDVKDVVDDSSSSVDMLNFREDELINVTTETESVGIDVKEEVPKPSLATEILNTRPVKQDQVQNVTMICGPNSEEAIKGTKITTFEAITSPDGHEQVRTEAVDKSRQDENVKADKLSLTYDNIHLRSLQKDYSDVLEHIDDRQGSSHTEINSSRGQAGVMSTDKELFVNAKDETCEENKDIDLLLLGKTGNGKSSTGNSILNKDFFDTADNLNSTTKKIQCENGTFNGRKIKVVDGPGFEDTQFRGDLEKSTEMMIEKMGDAILKHPKGYHAFIFVHKYGNKLTNEDKKVIEMLKGIFGKNVIKDYCILLLTYGDNFKSNKANKNKKFMDWCSEQTDIFFKDILMECGNRVVLFDNNTEDPKIKDKQMKQLIDKIDNLQYHGRRYCDKNFKEAEERRKLLLLKHQTERITDEIRQETSSLMEQIKTTNDLEPVKQIQELTTISEKCKILTKKVTHSEDGKPIFKDALCIVSNINSFIESNLKTAIKQKEKQDIEEKMKNREHELLQKIIKLDEKSNLGAQEEQKLRQQIDSDKKEIKKLKSENATITKDIATLTAETNPSLEKITNASLKKFFKEQNIEHQRLEKELEERTGTFRKRLYYLFKEGWRSKTSTPT